MVSRRQVALPPPPPLGHAVPQNIYHAISVQMPTWEDMQGLMLRSEKIQKAQKIGYPRSFLHPDVAQLHTRILKASGERPGRSCLAFPTWDHADACARLVTARSPGALACIVKVSLQLGGNLQPTLLYATIYDIAYVKSALEFWRLTGTGISSRFAEYALTDGQEPKVDAVVDGPRDSTEFRPACVENEYSTIIRERICDLLQRASLRPDISCLVSPKDVYLYPTGMSAIYHCNRLLNTWRSAESVVFGFLYELTPKLLQTYSESFHFYGFGTEDELDQLEDRVKLAHSTGKPIQSVWCECPSNPLLHTVNLTRLRKLADIWHFVLVVDETIGTFANVDLLPVADVLVTSLTKAFSGNADVMGGSLILNPFSPVYEELTKILSSTHVSELHELDARVLEFNSRLFLSRVATMNQNTYHLVSLLASYASLPDSVITKVFHPSILPSRANYDLHLRKSSPEIIPGHGALFTIEFESEKAASTFFNNLDIHKGPSLGACVTLAQPYVQTVFALEKDWAAYYGLSETIIRISVGIEDPVSLTRAFRRAFSKANWTKLGCRCSYEGVCVSDRH